MCSFNEKELAEFHQYLEKSFPFSDATKVKCGVFCAGKQPGEEVWALNNHLFIDGNGSAIPEDANRFVWQPIGGPSIELAGKSTAGAVDLQCSIHLPLLSEEKSSWINESCAQAQLSGW